MQCAGVHREFGVTVSFVQSLTLDTLKDEYKDALRKGGNARFHESVVCRLPREVVYCQPGPSAAAASGDGTSGSGGDGGGSGGGANGFPYAHNIDRMYQVYHSRVAELYRRQLRARVQGEPEPTEVGGWVCVLVRVHHPRACAASCTP